MTDEMSVNMEINLITRERDIARSVLPPSYHYSIDKNYRHIITKLVRGSETE